LITVNVTSPNKESSVSRNTTAMLTSQSPLR